MRIDFLTVVPEMLEPFINRSILKRATDKGLAEFHIHNLRDYTTSRHRKVDDYPFGGEAGMVMQIQPIDACISALKRERDYDEVIFTTPDGEQFDQPMANQLSMLGNVIILCGHYKGVDYRVREHLITKEISIGDYVLTGGELPAAVIADASVRIMPNTTAGGCPTSCCPATKQRLQNGVMTRRLNAHAGSDLTSCVKAIMLIFCLTVLKNAISDS